MISYLKRGFSIFIIASLFFASKVYPAAEDKKFNVVLIVVDALRADHLGCYGYPRDTSPAIDKLAKKGVIFTNAFSQGSSTEVSMSSILTSLYPGVHQVLEWEAVLPDKLLTWPEILSKNGYLSVAFQDKHVNDILGLGNRFNLLLGQGLKPGQKWSKPSGSLVTDRAINFFKRDRRRPFFLYLHYMDVHYPYIADSPYDKMFWRDEITPELKGLVQNFVRGEQGEYIAIPAKSLEFIISQYDATIRHTDDQIARLFEELDREGLTKNTLIILTADHGEGFFEHGRFFHSNSLYDELTHVPLIMKLPENLPQNKVFDNPVRHVDILPTVLDVLGIRIKNFMQGKSLLPLILGRAEYKVNSFAESWRGYVKGIRTAKWKLIENYDPDINVYSYELYNLEKDRKELNNLIKDVPEEAGVLKQALKDYVSSCVRAREKLLGRHFKQRFLPIEGERKEILKQLNYLQ